MKKIILTALLIISPFLIAEGLKKRIIIEKKTRLIPTLSERDVDEKFNLQKSQILNKKRTGLIEDIKKFIREAKHEGQKVELNLRLGALYMEEYHASLAKAQNVLDKEYAIYQKNPKAYKKAPQIDASEANATLDRAKGIYKDLSKRFPQHPRRDEMLYFLAMISQDRGNVNESVRYFQEITEKYPRSKYINESYVQLADHYFENNKFAIAQGYFDKLITLKDSHLLVYAKYRKAWCYYNLQQPKLALQYFKWVIENEDSEKSNSPIRIRNEAIRDITLPFVDLKLAEESIEFFRNLGDSQIRKPLETMASLYFEQGDHKNSILMNETLLNLDVNHSKNPSYDISVIESLKSKNERNESVNRLFEKLPVYSQNSTWYEINSSHPEIIKQATVSFEETARKFALELHAEAQSTKNPALYSLVRNLYEKYLLAFPHSTQSPQLRFYLAEILYKQGNYGLAADHYFQVYKQPNSPGSLKIDAIRYTLNSLDHEINQQRKKAGLSEISTKSTSKIKETEDAQLQQTAYSDYEDKFINIGNEYLTNYPKQKDAPDVLYQQAYLHYMHYDFPKAYKSFWLLIQTYPQYATSYNSAYLILDILNRKKDFSKLIMACQKFLTVSAFSKPEFKKEVADILRHAELKKIQIVENENKYKEAAKAYFEYTKTYGPQDEVLFEKALYNASVNFTKAELFLESLDVQEQFLRRFPKSELRQNMLLQVAKTHETLSHFDKAAMYFELFSKLYPKDPQAQNALRLAGLYFWGAGNTKKAEELLYSFMNLYPANKNLIEKDLMDIYQSEGATDKQIQFYLKRRAERGISISQYVSDTLKIAEISATKSGGKLPLQLMEEAFKVSNKYSKELLQTPKGVQTLAKIRFWVVNQKEAYFYKIRLVLPQKQLEINLQRKMAILKELEKEYGQVASLGGGEWGLGSIYKTAAAYKQMASEVQQAPVPAELGPEQLDQYRAEIQKQMVKPFLEKSLNLVAQCLDKSQEFNLMTTWTAKCFSLGAEIEPEKYLAARSFYLPATQVSLILPNKETSKTELGNYKNYAYPFSSESLFRSPNSDRTIASKQTQSLYQGNTATDSLRAVPMLMTYRILADDRRELISRAISSENPKSAKDRTFAYLNLLRLNSPGRAITQLQDAIMRDPQNSALHNLLGLAYLDSGNTTTAKILWLSMLARGIKHPAIWNNLGVVSILEGNENIAIDYYNEAGLLEGAKESFSNLGFLALKYRNGIEAKRNFEKSLHDGNEEVLPQVGLAVAKLQSRDFDGAKENLISSTKQFKTDPYGRISLAYFFIDFEKQPSEAKQQLNDFLQLKPNAESDIQLRNAFRDAGTVASSSLPSKTITRQEEDDESSTDNVKSTTKQSDEELPSVE